MFTHIFAGGDGVPERLMIDATHLTAHCTAASLAQKEILLVVVCDGQGRPVALLLT